MSTTPEPLLQSVPASFGDEPEWLQSIRAQAAGLLEAKGLPSKKTEAWRFTSVQALEKAPFVRERSVLELVSEPSQGVQTRSIREVLASDPTALAGRLGRNADEPFFAALNTALFEDGLWIHVPPGVRVAAPVELRHEATESRGEASVSYPRIVVTLGEGSELTLVETYAGRDPRRLTNSVVEVQLGDRSKVKHVRIHQDEGYCLGRVDVRQGAASHYHSTVLTLGGALTRLDIRAQLQGEGARCELDGAYLVDGHAHADHHTSVDHQVPRCHSEQTYRGIVGERGTAVFDGIVFVRRDAQQTEAHQENRNLLLSDTATVHTKPHLEIDADDVVCSHGATVGSLDPQQLFYLRTRGIPEDLARAMLTHAFIQQIVDEVDHAPTRARMEEAVLTRIPHGREMGGLA